MELKQIKYFLALSETLNFTDAATLSNVSQPALTKAIQRLEEEVGGALIHRDGKHTRLSELGRKMLGEFKAIRDSEERALQLASSHVVEGDTTIRLGIANTLGPRPFGPLLNSFLKDNPAVRITLHPVDAHSTQEQILTGTLDACLCVNAGRHSDKIRKTHLYEERLFAAMAQDHPLAAREEVTLEEIVQYPYIDRLNCEFRPSFVEEVQLRGYDVRTTFQSQREDWIQQMVKSGNGVTALPEHSNVVPGLVLRPIADMELGRTVSLISVLGSTGNSALQAIEKMASGYDWTPAQP